MEWISVKDNLPPDNEEVLLFHPFKRTDGISSSIIYVGWWDNLNKRWVCGYVGMLPPSQCDYVEDGMCLKRNKVKYWMPLPEPPKE